MILNRSFYHRSADVVAPELLGKKLVHHTGHGDLSGIIVEVEAYMGETDKGSHAYGNKRTPRTEVQFGEGGYAYVYSIYGMHCCFNVVANRPGIPEVVFVRALEPVDGIDRMRQNRKVTETEVTSAVDLCNGPGKLCTALEITKNCYGLDLCGGELYIEDRPALPFDEIGVSPRINIDYAEECRDYLWRYYIKNNKYVSKVARRYRSDLLLSDCGAAGRPPQEGAPGRTS